jgi:hypothetical protein
MWTIQAAWERCRKIPRTLQGRHQARRITSSVEVRDHTYRIERIHPICEGRSPQQIGHKGLSNHRWIVGGKLCLLVNQYGLVVGWKCKLRQHILSASGHLS